MVVQNSNVCLVGTLESDSFGTSFWIGLLDASGNFLQQWLLRGPEQAPAVGKALARNQNGAIYAAGTVYLPGHGADVMVVCLEPSSSYRQYELNWMQYVNSPDNGNDEFVAIHTCPDGGVVIGASTETPSGKRDVLLAKFSEQGQLQWTTTFSETWASDEQMHDMAVSADGSIYVTGEKDGDVFLLNFNADGRLLWRSYYDSPNQRTDIGLTLTLDSTGNIIVAGNL